MRFAKCLRIAYRNQFRIGLHRRRDEMGKGMGRGFVVAARGAFGHVVPVIKRLNSGAKSIKRFIKIESLQIDKRHLHVSLMRPKLEGKRQPLLFEQLGVGHSIFQLAL